MIATLTQPQPKRTAWVLIKQNTTREKKEQGLMFHSILVQDRKKEDISEGGYPEGPPMPRHWPRRSMGRLQSAARYTSPEGKTSPASFHRMPLNQKEYCLYDPLRSTIGCIFVAAELVKNSEMMKWGKHR